jgi:hypothetical protein
VIFVPNLVNHYDYYFRHFDVELSYSEAEEFCKKLPGLSTLGANSSQPHIYIGENPMLKHILGADYTREVQLLEGDRKMRLLPENKIIALSDPNKPRPFVCRVALADH